MFVACASGKFDLGNNVFANGTYINSANIIICESVFVVLFFLSCTNEAMDRLGFLHRDSWRTGNDIG